jgi:hypothetical protein
MKSIAIAGSRIYNPAHKPRPAARRVEDINGPIGTVQPGSKIIVTVAFSGVEQALARRLTIDANGN